MNAKKVPEKSNDLNLTLKVFNLKGKEVENLTLDATIFDGKTNPSLMHQAVVTYQANQRKGLASAKTRGEVRGGGRKPWRQKGTGRARVGSIRSPLWKGGGVTFGPKPRSYNKSFPKKMRSLALKSALNVRLINKQILLIENLSLESHKTKNISDVIKNLKITGEKVKFVAEKLENNLKMASRNMQKISIAKASDLHTNEVLDCTLLILTKSALSEVEGRLKKCL